MGLAAIKESVRELSADEQLELVQEILRGLSPQERPYLAASFAEQDKQAWDKEIERDFSAGGAGMHLLHEVDALIEKGKVKSFKVTRPRGKP